MLTMPAIFRKPVGPIFLLLSLCGCGEPSTEPEQMAVVYDETTNGPLPYSLNDLSQTDLAKYTVLAHPGTNLVTGTSVSGEAILLKIPAGSHLQSVSVDFTSHISGNGLVVYVERYPYDGTHFIDPHDMLNTGRYSYSVSAPNASYTNGDYALRISTAVQGASIPNEFTLGVRIVE
jgi:hypothetical protein